MSTTLQEVIASLKTELPQKALELDEQMMVDLWINPPDSPHARTVVVQRGARILSATFHLDDSDLTRE